MKALHLILLMLLLTLSGCANNVSTSQGQALAPIVSSTATPTIISTPTPTAVPTPNFLDSVDACLIFVGKTGLEITDELNVLPSDWNYLELIEGGHCFYLSNLDYIFTFSSDDFSDETPLKPNDTAKCLMIRVPLCVNMLDSKWDIESNLTKLAEYFGVSFDLQEHPLTGTRNFFAVDLARRLTFSVYEDEPYEFSEDTWVEINYMNDSNYEIYSSTRRQGDG